MDNKKIGDLLEELRRKKPLVHHITNYVTVNDCANITLHMGAQPVMAHAQGEVEEMVAFAGALVLNIGTLDPAQVESMILAGKKANELGIPVILDPVGAGATKLRTDAALKIMNEVKISYLKGNSAEVGILSGAGGEIRGVDAVSSAPDPAGAAAGFALERGFTVVVTGKEDIITNGKTIVRVNNGHPLMGTITGTGCMAASVIGSFAGVEKDPVTAASAALICYGIAGQLAAAEERVKGPASFKTAFFDRLYNLNREEIEKYASYIVD